MPPDEAHAPEPTIGMAHGGHNERFLRIVGRHEITSRALAHKSGLNEGHVSRILDGQYSVPVELIRAAWHLTRDGELAALCLDDDLYLISIDRAARDRPREALLHTALHTCIQCTFAIGQAQHGAPVPLAPAINALVGTLATVAFAESSRPVPLAASPPPS
jgi:hypothetical protein